MTAIRQGWAILRKDLLLEMRSKEVFTSQFLFVVMAMVIFYFAFSPNMKNLTAVGAGMLWVAITFTSLLGLNRSFVHEKDEECLDGLLLCPVDRATIFAAKFIGNFIFLTTLEVIAVPIFAFFFLTGTFLANLGWFVLILFLGNIGICGVGTLLATISMNTRARDLLLPVLFLPVMVPVIIPMVLATNYIFTQGKAMSELSVWLYTMAIFDIMYVVAGYVLYDFVIGD